MSSASLHTPDEVSSSESSPGKSSAGRSSTGKPSGSDDRAHSTDDMTCPCGHHIDHHMVSPVRSYSIWGWIRFVMGITAVPTRIRFTCRRCDEVIHETKDPDVMRERTYR